MRLPSRAPHPFFLIMWKDSTVSTSKKQATEKRQSKSKRTRGGFTWVGFLEVDLTPQQKDELKATDIALEYPLSELGTWVKNGYKVSFGLDKDGITYRAAMTDVDEGSPTCGYTLTGRGRTLEKAYASLMFKHRHILADGWHVPVGGSDAPDFA